jgi:catechol 2,3-dioxygenase-like lactoylglutathione lyase family enzyme
VISAGDPVRASRRRFAKRCRSPTRFDAMNTLALRQIVAPGGSFDELRVGLDHLAFAVTDRDELDAWSQRLTLAGVTHSPVAAANSIPGAAVLVLRDPDNIQLELFHDPSATFAPGPSD